MYSPKLYCFPNIDNLSKYIGGMYGCSVCPSAVIVTNPFIPPKYNTPVCGSRKAAPSQNSTTLRPSPTPYVLNTLLRVSKFIIPMFVLSQKLYGEVFSISCIVLFGNPSLVLKRWYDESGDSLISP